MEKRWEGVKKKGGAKSDEKKRDEIFFPNSLFFWLFMKKVAKTEMIVSKCWQFSKKHNSFSRKVFSKRIFLFDC